MLHFQIGMHRLAREARLMGDQCDLGSLGTEFVNLVIAFDACLMVSIIPFLFAVRTPVVPGRKLLGLLFRKWSPMALVPEP